MKASRISFIALTAAIVLSWASTGLSLDWNFTPIDYPGMEATVPQGMNNKGEVVGYYDIGGSSTVLKGFHYDGSNFWTLDYPGSYETWARAINNGGQIGGDRYHSPYDYLAYTYNGSDYTPVVYPGSDNYTVVWDINDGGSAVGRYQLGGHSRGFRFDGSNYYPIDYPGSVDTEVYGFSNTGYAAGGYRNLSEDWRGFIYNGITYTPIDYPSASSTFLYDTNDAGHAVGYYTDSGVYAFLYNGTCIPINPADAVEAEAVAINASDQVVGWYKDSSKDIHGFFFDEGTCYTVDYPGSDETYLTDINDDGKVIGYYVDSSGDEHGFLASAGPSNPLPDIRANGSDGPLNITTGSSLSVTIELDSGDFLSDNADYWLLGDAYIYGSHYLFYWKLSGEWLPGVKASYQGPLADVSPPFEVLNHTGFPPGTYTFYFGVDLNMNGLIDADVYYDMVTVIVK